MDEYKSEIIISEENLAVYEEIHKKLEKIQERTNYDISRYMQYIIFEVIHDHLIPMLKKSGVTDKKQLAKLRKYANGCFPGVTLKEMRKRLH